MPAPGGRGAAAAEAGNQRKDGEDGTDGQRNVRESAQNTVILAEPDNGDGNCHGHDSPAQLIIACVLPDPVQPVDHGQPQPVERHDQRKRSGRDHV